MVECSRIKINGISRKVIGSNDCNSKWVIYCLKCDSCDLFYIGKTLNEFKKRFSTHKSVIKNCALTSGNFSESEKDVRFLLQHFRDCHKNDKGEVETKSLKWLILHNVGKVDRDPAVNLLCWERAYIEGFDTVWPKGLNAV